MLIIGGRKPRPRCRLNHPRPMPGTIWFDQCPKLRGPRRSLEKLRTDAAEAALIRDLATDSHKRELFQRLAAHFATLAAEVERAIAARPVRVRGQVPGIAFDRHIEWETERKPGQVRPAKVVARSCLFSPFWSHGDPHDQLDVSMPLYETTCRCSFPLTPEYGSWSCLWPIKSTTTARPE